MDYFLLCLASIFLILGLVGCFVPVIPGPPLSFVGLLLLQVTHFGNLASSTLWLFGVLTLLVTAIDYIIPIWGTRKWGGSGYGVVGAALGLVIGFVFGPIGLFFGPFLGAVAGEILSGKDTHEALKAGMGAFIGFVLGTAIKMSLVFVIIFYFISEIFK